MGHTPAATVLLALLLALAAPTAQGAAAEAAVREVERAAAAAVASLRGDAWTERSAAWDGALAQALAIEPPLAAPLAARVAGACLDVLEVWLPRVDPVGLLPHMAERWPGATAALALETPRDRRRALLAAIADRGVQTAESDVRLLAAVAGWAGLFAAGRPAGRPQLLQVTADLMWVFTERTPDGVGRSGSRWYRPGRCGDRGFHEALRDGSDQVRHAVWAWRMFSLHDLHDQTEALLTFKEQRDAQRRGVPLNRADLRLNKAARALAAEVLDHEGTPPAPGDDPAPASRYPELVRRHLGPAE
jgi:hypothetical protein